MADTCPTGCGRAVRRGHLTCPACWRQVPYDLQRQVYRTFREWNRHLGDTVRYQAYVDARDAAIASIP